MHGATEKPIRLSWVDDIPTRYHSPIDGKVYEAPGGWKTYKPNNDPSPKEPGKVATEEVVLLTPEHQINESVTVTELASFCRTVESLSQNIFMESHQASTILIQFDCTTTSHTVRIACQGAPEKQLLQALYEAAMRMDRLPVKKNTVSFQMQFRVLP
jgi:hypothetical protein